MCTVVHLEERMMLQGEDVQTLKQFGLTFLQAKVYLTLVRTGKSTVRNIAENANVARQEAQRVTTELQKIGLVEEILANPTEFDPIPLNEAVKFLLELREKASLDLEEKANLLLENFVSNRMKKFEEQKTAKFVIASGKEAIIRKSRMVVDRTKESCFIINGLWKNIGYASSLFKEQTIKALKRQVKFRVLTEKLPEEQSIHRIYKDCLENPNFEIRFLSAGLPAMLGIYDKKELLVSTCPEKLIADSPMLWTNDQALICAAQTYFDDLWRQASPPRNLFSTRQTLENLT